MKSHFWFNKSQRNGILFLVLIIVILQLVYFFIVPNLENKTTIEINKSPLIQRKIDSIKQLKILEKETEHVVKIYPFNPSYITDFKGYQLGMSPDEIDRVLKHRTAGKFINSAEEFQDITKISDSLLEEIAPYFKFPEWVTNPTKNKREWETKETTANVTNQASTSKVDKAPLVIKDINTASAPELQSISGIGKKLADRIISYRKKLGGFSLNSQLYEVYYLDKEVADKVLLEYKILSKPVITKINVNTATFKEVLSIIYIDYELTKKIFEYRDEVAEIQSLEELKKNTRLSDRQI